MRLAEKLLPPALCFSAILLLITAGIYVERKSHNKPVHTAATEIKEQEDVVYVVDLPNDVSESTNTDAFAETTLSDSTEGTEQPADPNATVDRVETPEATDTTEVTQPQVSTPQVQAEPFQYLAIGNSVTIHQICDYWWGAWGMAASSRENDYVHLVQSQLLVRYGKNTSVSLCSFIPWEKALTGNDRLTILNQLEPYLNDDLDLVTVQLGDGLIDETGLESDYENMLTYIKAHAPNAQVMLIGNFWDNGNINSIKQQAAAACKVDYIDLTPLTTGENEAIFRSKMGDIVWGDDGQAHKINVYDVAQHPNDQAMAWIATYILEAIKQ